MTDLDASPITRDLDACANEIARLRGLMLRQSELLGAAVAVLSSIHKAGGWHVLDPFHKDHMRASLDALEAAVEAMLNQRARR